ncbi:methyltransferase domain-containing protein [Eleftheria terrae]|uniref:methyltransferase domain-containing protein n=1 Tax=Eleftheria terrae TaxID=1597781 RepID=UPI00263BD0F2|nr:methyltransferase domain-containing protein [Eleftheria terrae]WKB51079.1 methyltransferase domain-containing protein [Eleftheria terrae]
MRRLPGCPLSAWADGRATLGERPDLSLRGEAGWARFGIRDPVPLIDADGQAVADGDGRLTLFFNARSAPVEHGGVTCVGVAHGRPAEGWRVDPEPVFQDGPYAALGSALQLAPDHYRLYYSPDTLQGFRMASSVDARSWHLGHAGALILKPKDFGIRRMGLPFVRRIEGRWVMLFEGVDNGAFHLYMAQSGDGVHWEPSHGGRPIYQPAAGAWDAYGQANPSLYQHLQADGRAVFSILYNGCSSLYAWDVGLLSAEGIDGPWQGRPAPLLRRGPPGTWNGCRVEGARLIERAGEVAGLTYFGLPTQDSYAGGQIAFACLETTEVLPAFARDAAQSNAQAERRYNAGLARRYFDVWDHYPIQRYTTEFESDAMRRSIPPASRVVVLGSGGGRELPALIEQGCDITAVDISPDMLEAGRQRYPGLPIQWVEADLHDLPDSLTGFHAAVCLGAVFNYLREPEVFLAAARDCLTEQGVLLLSAINARHPSEPAADARLSDGRWRRLYTVDALRALVEAAGFLVERVDGLRFLVDLLPSEWNRGESASTPQGQILSRLLQDERRLSEHLVADRAKFILLLARRGTPPGRE